MFVLATSPQLLTAANLVQRNMSKKLPDAVEPYELTFFVVRGYIYLALAGFSKSSLALIRCVYKGVRADGSSFTNLACTLPFQSTSANILYIIVVLRRHSSSSSICSLLLQSEDLSIPAPPTTRYALKIHDAPFPSLSLSLSPSSSSSSFPPHGRY